MSYLFKILRNLFLMGIDENIVTHFLKQNLHREQKTLFCF